MADGRLYILYTRIPRTQMTSIFEGQPTKIRPFLIKARVIWVLGMRIFLILDVYLLCIVMPMYLFIYILSIYFYLPQNSSGCVFLRLNITSQKTFHEHVSYVSLFLTRHPKRSLKYPENSC